MNKPGIPFTAIVSAHAIEQENCALKVIGGINSEVTINEYFLTAAEMGNIVNNFCEETNCTKRSHVFSEHDVTFEGQDSVYDIFTKVLPTDVADRFL